MKTKFVNDQPLKAVERCLFSLGAIKERVLSKNVRSDGNREVVVFTLPLHVCCQSTDPRGMKGLIDHDNDSDPKAFKHDLQPRPPTARHAWHTLRTNWYIAAIFWKQLLKSVENEDRNVTVC